MKQLSKSALALVLAACAGCAAGGGPIGSGISSIQGNIVDVEENSAAAVVTSAELRLPFRVKVRLPEFPGVEAETDDEGNFVLSGEFSGPLVLRFMHAAKVLASLPLDVPAGSTIVLEDIELRSSLPDGIRTRNIRQRNFFGRVFLKDCDAGVVLVNDEGHMRRQFLARLSPRTTIRAGIGGPLITCADMRRGRRVLIEGIVLPDRTIAAGTVIFGPPFHNGGAGVLP